jgi:long-chain acyl-CoA synthetase
MRKREGYQTYTYREAHRAIISTSQFLSERGLHADDRAAILSENRPEWIIAYLGTVWCGNVAVPLDTHLSQDALANLINDSQAKAIFCSESYLDIVLEATPRLSEAVTVICFDDVKDLDQRIATYPNLHGRVYSLRDVIDHESDDDRPPIADEDSLASIIYTSGTTGTPKGVMLSHKNFVSCASANVSRTHLTEHDHFLSVLPLYHSFEFSGSFITSVLAGSRITFIRSLKGSEIISTMVENGITYMCGVPLLWEGIDKKICDTVHKKGKMASAIFFGLLRLSSHLPMWVRKLLFRSIHRTFGGKLHKCISGGAAIRPDVARRFASLGFEFHEGYGLTESAPVITFNDDVERKPGSVGKAFPETNLRIANPNGEGVGEVCYRGPNVMKGYYHNDEETSETIDEEGFLHTGDLGRIDEDGYLTICGRLKNIIVLPGGKNVYPDELEEHYNTSPLISEIGVVGIDRGRGEEIVAAAVPDPAWAHGKEFDEIEKAIRDEIKRLSNELPPYKRVSTTLISISPLPRTSIQKIKKAELQEYIMECLSAHHRRVDIDSEQSAADAHMLDSEEGKGVMHMLGDLVHDKTAVKTASLDSKLDSDLDLDSLARVEMGIAIEDNFMISIADAELFEMETVRDVIVRIHEGIASGNRQSREDVDHNWKDKLLLHHSDELKRRIEKPAPSWRRLLLVVFRALSKLLWRIDVEGLENLPKAPFVLAPNHSSHADIFWVSCMLPQSIGNVVYALGKKEHFENFFTSLFATAANVIPVDRSGNFLPALRAGAGVLQRGNILFLHPEGTRTSDGSLLPFKSGVGILAEELNVPVVPVAIRGSYDIFPNSVYTPRLFNWKKMRRHRLTIAFGAPLSFSDLEQGEAEAFASELRDRVAQLLDRS